MEKVNMALSGLKPGKEGGVSKTRVDAVGEACMRALRHDVGAGEVADALCSHLVSVNKDMERLGSFYALHSGLYLEKKRLEEKNGRARTEKRGPLSLALELKLDTVAAYCKETSVKDKEQIAKIVKKWADRAVFPRNVCDRFALHVECELPEKEGKTEEKHVAAAPTLVLSIGGASSAPAMTAERPNAITPLSHPNLSTMPSLLLATRPAPQAAPQSSLWGKKFGTKPSNQDDKRPRVGN